MRHLALIMAVLICAGPGAAGPWLRATGERFLSFSTEWTGPGDDIFASAYFEYGVTPRVTLGFDLGSSESDFYKAVIFAKRPLDWFGSPLKMSVEMGVGVTDDAAVVRPGVSLGRGFALGSRSGWITVDTLFAIEIESGDTDLTTDVTFGVNLSGRSKLILQLQSGDHLLDPDYLKFVPSFVFETRPGQHFEIGALTGLRNSEDLGLKLGLWRKF